MDIRKYIKSKVNLVNRHLKKIIPSEKKIPVSIHKAMHYSVFAGGKRLRPIFVIASAEMYGLKTEQVLDTACGIELLHTYSLIHDDLPCMDNDDYRRGKLTSHKVFGEAAAVLCGDALLTLSYECFARNSRIKKICSGSVINVIKEVCGGAGTAGMLGGQVLDIEAEGNRRITSRELKRIHSKKTAGLITSSIKCGAILGNASDREISILSEFGKKIGLAFQIVDDILDETGTTENLGKKAGSDKDRNKMTYPRLYGIAGSVKESEKLLKQSVNLLDKLNRETGILKGIAELLVKRSR